MNKMPKTDISKPMASSAKEIESDLNVDDIEVNSRYYCKIPSGSFHVCEVIAKRINANTKKQEYYVHFKDSDRRLDDWLEIEEFDLSRKVANVTQTSQSKTNGVGDSDNRVTRTQKRKIEDEAENPEDESLVMAASKKEHLKLTKIKHINQIWLGYSYMKIWYYSHFPEQYLKWPTIYMCDLCLFHTSFEERYVLHLDNCTLGVPGKRIYQKEDISVFEIDAKTGKRAKRYCQCLCLMAKCFLDHKTLFYDVEPFLFYVMTKMDGKGRETIVGYFSKERGLLEGNNLACILVLPNHQKKGYGKFLIWFSYEISKLEGKAGSPEKPLSDLGYNAYLSYWKFAVLNVLKNLKADESVTFDELMKLTSITKIDILSALHNMSLVDYFFGKDTICSTPKIIEGLLSSEHYKVPSLAVEPLLIKWHPSSIVKKKAHPSVV